MASLIPAESIRALLRARYPFPDQEEPDVIQPGMPPPGPVINASTYKGQDIAQPDYVDSAQRLFGKPLRNLPNDEDLNAWPEATPDYVPRPGQKHYRDQEFAPPLNYFAMAARR